MMMQQAHDTGPQLLPLGLDGFLVRFSDHFTEAANRAARLFGAEALTLEPVAEVMPALSSVLVRFDPARTDRAALQGALSDLLSSRDWMSLPPEAPTRRWHLPVSFDTEDAPHLSEVADLSGRSEAATIAQVLESAPRVLAIGFAPGQPYLGLMPENWAFPRRTDLVQVPAGALATAIRQFVLFANASPTGWRQIGRCAFRCFQPAQDDPMPLRAGDEMRFHRVSGAELKGLLGDPMGGARLELLS